MEHQNTPPARNKTECPILPVRVVESHLKNPGANRGHRSCQRHSRPFPHLKEKERLAQPVANLPWKFPNDLAGFLVKDNGPHDYECIRTGTSSLTRSPAPITRWLTPCRSPKGRELPAPVIVLAHASVHRHCPCPERSRPAFAAVEALRPTAHPYGSPVENLLPLCVKRGCYSAVACCRSHASSSVNRMRPPS